MRGRWVGEREEWSYRGWVDGGLGRGLLEKGEEETDSEGRKITTMIVTIKMWYGRLDSGSSYLYSVGVKILLCLEV